MAKSIECGRFKLDENDVLEAPKQYMADQGNVLVEKIMAGDDAIFNMCAGQSPSPRMAVLVRLQTDYAGWAGMQQVQSMMS